MKGLKYKAEGSSDFFLEKEKLTVNSRRKDNNKLRHHLENRLLVLLVMLQFLPPPQLKGSRILFLTRAHFCERIFCHSFVSPERKTMSSLVEEDDTGKGTPKKKANPMTDESLKGWQGAPMKTTMTWLGRVVRNNMFLESEQN